MAVKIRLTRVGSKKNPIYRVVVTDSRAPRDGRFIEIVGRYNPRTEPSTVELDLEKIDAWVAKGAQPTEVVVKLIAIARGEKEAPVQGVAVSKKAAAKAAAEVAAAAKAVEDAAKAAKEAKDAKEAAAKEAKEAAAAAAVAEAEPKVEEEVADEAADTDAKAAE